MSERNVTRLVEPRIVMEGAGVKVRRTIGSVALRQLDPFLLLDHFGSGDPDEYRAGFPMHMHRGVQTLTYMLVGSMTHEDNSGGRGKIGPGGAQLMTAGRMIRHSEMPEAGEGGRMEGLQLWFDLPRERKDITPRYEDAASDAVPELTPADGVTVRVVTGTLASVSGPITGVEVPARYLDVRLAPGSSHAFDVPADHTAFAYVIEGEPILGGAEGTRVEPNLLAILGRGDRIPVRTEDQPARFILVSAAPAG